MAQIIYATKAYFFTCFGSLVYDSLLKNGYQYMGRAKKFYQNKLTNLKLVKNTSVIVFALHSRLFPFLSHFMVLAESQANF